MNKKDEALRIALEALEPLIVERTCEAMDAGEKAITAIKEALAQPEQVTKAALWDLAIRKGLVTVHSEQLAPATWSAHLSVASWMEGHAKACDISNEAAHGIKE